MTSPSDKKTDGTHVDDKIFHVNDDMKKNITLRESQAAFIQDDKQTHRPDFEPPSDDELRLWRAVESGEDVSQVLTDLVERRRKQSPE